MFRLALIATRRPLDHERVDPASKSQRGVVAIMPVFTAEIAVAPACRGHCSVCPTVSYNLSFILDQGCTVGGPRWNCVVLSLLLAAV